MTDSIDERTAAREAGFYVYTHRRANGVPFYVGKGMGNRAHNRVGRSDAWKRIVAEHGLLVRVELKGLTEDQAFDAERLLIALLGRETLINRTSGGQGTSNPSAETRAKLVAATIGNTRFLGRTHSPETRSKMSAHRVGMKFSEEHRANLSIAHKGTQSARGHRVSETLREKLRAQHTGNSYAAGHTVTPEARALMSAKAKAAWARRKAQTTK